MKKKKPLTKKQRLFSINRQIMKWQRALSYGGSIRGKKNPDLCQRHLDRCLRTREQIEAELEN